MPRSRRAGPTHELLVTRLTTTGLGLVAGLSALGMVTVVEQPHVVAIPALYRAALLMPFLLAVLLGAFAFLAPLAVLRLANGVVAVSYLVLIAALWPVLLLTGAAAPSGQLTWLMTVTSLPVLSAVIAWGTAGGWLVLGVLGTGIPLLKLAIGDTSPSAITNDVDAVCAALLLCLFSCTVLASAREADHAALTAREAAMQRAQALARRSAQLRAQTLVHDEVLATFGFAARATRTMLPVLAEQARRARELVQALAVPAATGEVPIRTFEADLRALAAANGAHFEVWSSAPGLRLPVDAVGALLGAAQQALLNSAQHAPESGRRLVLECSTRVLQLVVADDGPGFDPALPARTQRMGITVSILARMNALHGGSAEIRTVPGTGTTVVLGWRPSEDASTLAPAAVSETTPTTSLRDRDLRLAGVLMAAGQILLAVYGGPWRGDPAESLAAGAGLIAGALIATWRAAVPGWLTLVAFGTISAATVGTLLFAPFPAAPTYADYGVFTGAAVTIGVFCLRGRPLFSLLMLGVDGIVLAVAVAGHEPGQLPSSFARGLSIVLVGVLLAYGHRRLHRSAARSRDAETAASASRAWDLALQDEVRATANHLVQRVGPLLRRLEDGVSLTPAEAAECVVLEGGLRDEYRGGRLAGDLVLSAAAEARRRGVDVVLIDDVPDLDDHDDAVPRALVWLAAELATVRSGSFTARMLPVGRGALVSAVANGRVASFER